ncbi:MAG: hypothetical protein ABFE08_05115, partial [Armatimonadia bacterium]
MRKLAICIVNWNTRDLLDRCLQSIHETTTGDLASGCAASDCAVSGCRAGARTPPAVIPVPTRCAAGVSPVAASPA